MRHEYYCFEAETIHLRGKIEKQKKEGDEIDRCPEGTVLEGLVKSWQPQRGKSRNRKGPEGGKRRPDVSEPWRLTRSEACSIP